MTCLTLFGVKTHRDGFIADLYGMTLLGHDFSPGTNGHQSRPDLFDTNQRKGSGVSDNLFMKDDKILSRLQSYVSTKHNSLAGNVKNNTCYFLSELGKIAKKLI